MKDKWIRFLRGLKTIFSPSHRRFRKFVLEEMYDLEPDKSMYPPEGESNEK